MSKEILKLEPKAVWNYFYEITQIPRPSKKEEQIINYLEGFAKYHNLDYDKDEVGNLVIRKNAFKGYENKPWVALQSHMDMVCEKHSHLDFDFMKDPIETFIEGEWVKAKGTTLGADDGIGMAVQLAILADNTLEHGPIECLFTVDEETGLTGAFALKSGFLKSNILLNLDSEDDGEFFIGCAGGKDIEGRLNIVYDQCAGNCASFKILVSGLKGGHSGDDIDKGLGNANKIIARFIWENQVDLKIKISDIDGGNLRNAIAREAYAVVCVPINMKDELIKRVKEYDNTIKKELFVTDANVKIEIEDFSGSTEKIFNVEFQKRFLNMIMAMPHGVIAMAQDIKGFVETSTNLASIKIKENQLVIGTSQRSSVESAKDNMSNMVASVFELAGAEYKVGNGYPGWTPNPNSPILETSVASWKKLYNTEPVVRAIHAGLECGLFSEKYPNMDMISYGPTLRGVHSPDERLLIPTVQKFWDLTLDILKNVK